jgi:hypothetical protein
MQYNLKLRCNQLLKKNLDRDPVMLDDIDPTSKWVEESHPTEFDPEIEIDDLELGGTSLDPDPLLGVEVNNNVAPNMAHASTSHVA